MSRPWEPQVAVSPALARALIAGQFPDLADLPVELVGEGWDNTVFRVGELGFRFPRREIALQLQAAEVQLLPLLAERVELVVPTPLRLGRPDAGYPWPFVGHRWVPGRTGDSAALDDSARTALAAPLGHFLATLHAIPVAEATRRGAGPDPFGRFDRARQLARSAPRLDEIDRGRLFDGGRLRAALADAVRDLPPPRPRALVHGDLYARHLMVDDAGRLTGVIDWDDTHLGDPAADLSIAPGFLPPAAHAAFRAAYGPIDDDTWRLARFRALQYCILILPYANDRGDADLDREMRQSLHYLLG